MPHAFSIVISGVLGGVREFPNDIEIFRPTIEGFTYLELCQLPNKKGPRFHFTLYLNFRTQADQSYCFQKTCKFDDFVQFTQIFFDH